MIRAERMAVLAAIETVSGTDQVPTVSAQLRDVTINDIEGNLVEFDPIRTGMGGRVKALFGRHVSIKGKIFLGSSGTAGTAPAWDWVARCTQHAKVTSAGVKVEYTPIDTGFETASLYFNLEGNRTKAIGVGGGIKWRWPVGAFPEGEFDLQGLFASNDSSAYPAVDNSAWKIPPLFGKDTVPTFTIGGVAEEMQSLEISSGGVAEYSELINRKTIDLIERKASVSTTILEPAFSARIHQASIGVPGTYKAIAMIHGTVAGSIIKADVTNWQPQTFARGKISDKASLTLGGEIVPASGVADYKITVQ